jgi:hypothetical protein
MKLTVEFEVPNYDNSVANFERALLHAFDNAPSEVIEEIEILETHVTEGE